MFLGDHYSQTPVENLGVIIELHGELVKVQTEIAQGKVYVRVRVHASISPNTSRRDPDFSELSGWRHADTGVTEHRREAAMNRPGKTVSPPRYRCRTVKKVFYFTGIFGILTR